MNPLQQQQKQKVDVSSLTPEEQRLFRLYGKLPNKKDLLQNKLKERKYFDSGDYALSKAGKASDVGVTQIGREHPVPENIPHSSTSPLNNGTSISGSISGPSGAAAMPAAIAGPGGVVRGGSPVKEGLSGLGRESLVDEDEEAEEVVGSENAKVEAVDVSK